MMKHYSVLLEECLDGLHIKENGIYVDGTLGRAGHSSEILRRIPKGHLYAFDRDAQAIEDSRPRLEAIGNNFTLVHANFSSMKEQLAAQGIRRVDGILLDLGVSSPQFDEAARGFSYRFDAPLDMRMDQTQALTAYEVVNTWDYHRLVEIFFKYGEEKYAKQVARKMEAQRLLAPIETTFALVDVIKSALPAKVVNSKGHPAKKIFQAIRIAVNDELGEIQSVLMDALELLDIQGRLCVISFHSLEDRLVKEAFVKASSAPKIDKRLPILPDQIPNPPYRLVSKKPILAGAKELEENNRSHSAKLRIIERTR